MLWLSLACALLGLVAAGPAHAGFPGTNGKIVLSQSGGQGSADLFAINPDGSGAMNLTNTPQLGEWEPAWSADGRKIAFANSGGQLETMNADGSERRTIVGPGSPPRPPSWPTWSPDGQRIAFVQDRDIWVVNADGSGTSRVTFDTDRSGVRCTPNPPQFNDIPCTRNNHPAWSPDGREIAFEFADPRYDSDTCDCYTNEFHNPGIDAIRPDGTGRRRVIGGAWVSFDLYHDANHPDWSPDGTRIVFEHSPYTDEYDGYDFSLYTIGAEGGEPPGRAVTGTEWISAQNPTWSPDGQRLLFYQYIYPQDGGLYVSDLDGNSQTRIAPDMSSNGTHLGYDWQPLGAFDPYPRPAYGTPIQVPLVLANAECTGPNTSHAAPLGLGSCSPPVPQSAVLTTSSVGKGSGVVRLRVVAGNPATSEDEADVAVEVLATDVRCAALSSACPGGAGSDYSGATLLRARIRLTDRASGAGGVSATVQDTALDVPVSCTPTASSTLGSRCEVQTTADTLIPNWAKEEKRTIIDAMRIELLDPGSNGTGYGSGCPPACGDGDEATYLAEGLFLP